MNSDIQSQSKDSPYKLGDVVVFLKPKIIEDGLIARAGDIGLVTFPKTLSYHFEDVHVEWICGVYVNGHREVGVAAEDIRSANPVEAALFWNNQSDVYNLNKSVADAALENLRDAHRRLNENEARLERVTAERDEAWDELKRLANGGAS